MDPPMWPWHGEVNARRVLTRHILVVARFSVYPGRRIYWNMNTVRIQNNQSVVYVYDNHFTAW